MLTIIDGTVHTVIVLTRKTLSKKKNKGEKTKGKEITQR